MKNTKTFATLFFGALTAIFCLTVLLTSCTNEGLNDRLENGERNARINSQIEAKQARRMYLVMEMRSTDGMADVVKLDSQVKKLTKEIEVLIKSKK